MTHQVSNHQHSANNKGPWTGVDGRLWRHTIGRVSNLARIPINTVATLLQAGKIVVKTLALPVSYSIHGISNLIKKEDKRYEGAWSLRGVAIDGICFLGLIKTCGTCFVRTIVAPSKKDAKKSDFVKGVSRTFSVLKGDLQKLSTVYKLDKVFQRCLKS